MKAITETQNSGSDVDPLAELIVNTVSKSGTRAWLGLPPPEEFKEFRAEKAERDFQAFTKGEEARARQMAELKQAALRNIRRNESV